MAVAYYNPRLIGGAVEGAASPRGGLATVLALLLSLACIALALWFALHSTTLKDQIIAATIWLVVDGDTQGSGVIITPDGYALTAAHAVKNGQCSSIIATLNSGTDKAKHVEATLTEHVGKISRASPEEIGGDYALIKIQSSERLPYLPVTSSDDVVENTKCFIAGFPMGSQLSTSSKGPNVRFDEGTINAVRRGEDQGALAFETDIEIVQGQSGGPCVNQKGFVIGTVSMGSKEAASYLILPSSRYKHVWEPLMGGAR